MLTDGDCTHCNLIPGYRINDFGVCREICGDGVMKGEYECDDGNLLDGDGCSRDCEIETGFKCEGTNCWEIVPPKSTVSFVTKDNIFTMKFNEVIRIKGVEDLSTNLKGYIKGPSSPYDFSMEIYDPDNLLPSAVINNTRRDLNSSGITEIQVRIFDVKAPLYGGGIEKMEIWFEDNSVIQDLAGNNLTEGKTSGNLRYTEYISDGK